jgi:hypothetical protein
MLRFFGWKHRCNLVILLGKGVTTMGTRNPDISFLRLVKYIFSFFLSLHYQNNFLKNSCFLYLALFNSVAKKYIFSARKILGGGDICPPPNSQVTPMVGNAYRYHVKPHQLETMLRIIAHLIIRRFLTACVHLINHYRVAVNSLTECCKDSSVPSTVLSAVVDTVYILVLPTAGVSLPKHGIKKRG